MRKFRPRLLNLPSRFYEQSVNTEGGSKAFSVWKDVGMTNQDSAVQGAGAEAYTLRTLGWLFLAAATFVAFLLVLREDRLGSDGDMPRAIVIGSALIVSALVVRSLCANVANIVRLLAHSVRLQEAGEQEMKEWLEGDD